MTAINIGKSAGLIDNNTDYLVARIDGNDDEKSEDSFKNILTDL